MERHNDQWSCCVLPTVNGNSFRAQFLTQALFLNQHSKGYQMLSITDLNVSYGAVKAVHGVSLHIEKGETVALLGANGAGKTSILSAIVGLVPASDGRIVFDGENIEKTPTETIVRRGLTLVPEGRRIFPSLTVLENLRLGGATLKSHRQGSEKIMEMQTLFPILAERQSQLAGTLSGGQQQQLAIGRALMSNPRVLLLDEPSLGLAPLIVAEIFALIRRLKDQGLTILLVEQNARSALQCADRAYVLANGRIVASGSADEIHKDGKIEAAYLGGNL